MTILEPWLMASYRCAGPLAILHCARYLSGDLLDHNVSLPTSSRHKEMPHQGVWQAWWLAVDSCDGFRAKLTCSDIQEETAEQCQQQGQQICAGRDQQAQDAPRIGASASTASQRKTKSREPAFLLTTVTVLRPSEKSCDSTAAATTNPISRLA